MAIANTTIRIRKSASPGTVPSALDFGELALNYSDGKIFYKNSAGFIVTFSAAAAGVNSFTTVNSNSSLILATSSTDVLTLIPGNNVTFNTNTTSKSITINSTASGGGNTDQFARDVANSKTYTFYQNTAPTTANNTGDLWLHSDTGVVYENFGNTSSPLWAEFGPTGVAVNTAPGIISSTQLFVNYTPPTTVNAAIMITAANTKGGTGYADAFQITNTSAGVTNPNKFIRVTSIGELQVINSSYQIASLSLTDAGDLTLAGNCTVNGVTAGYAPNRPAFRVYGANTTNALTTTQNGTGQLNYNNWALDYNQGGYLNYTSGTFTAPVAGLYQINFICRNAGNVSYSQLICYKNNSIVMAMIEFAGSSTMNHAGAGTVAKLAAGDTLILKVAAGTITFDGNDHWSVVYIG